MNQYRHLSAFPENREVLAELQRRGIRAGILSNGDPEMLAVAVKSAGFAELLQHRISACMRCSASRPTPPPTRWAAALGLPAREILFVSSNGWDAIGATWFGYTTLWVNRAGAAAGPAGHRTHAHRQQPARRARLPFGRARDPGPPDRVKRRP
jgi:2-haloacid dehalogenase